jgi:hypothetical protein
MFLFYCNCTKEDASLVKRLSNQISKFYPESRLLVISDDETLDLNFTASNTTFIQSTHLKSKGKLNQFIRRNYQVVLSNIDKEKIVIKIDPDSYFLKRVDIENLNIISNQVAAKFVRWKTELGKYPFVSGAMIIFSKDVLETILKSELLDSPLFQKHDKEDLVLSALFHFLEIEVIYLPNISVAEWQINRDKDHLIHPVKIN